MILTGLLFGQDKKDIIKLTDGSIYQGEYVKIEAGNVFFKPEVLLVLNQLKFITLENSNYPMVWY